MVKKWKVVLLTGAILVLAVGGGLLIAKPFSGQADKKEAEKAPAVPAWRSSRTIQNPNYIVYKDEYDIVRNTSALSGAAAKFYDKYIEITAPSGKPIRILAQDRVTDEQLLYVHDILSFYLCSLGEAVQNQLADSGQCLVLPNGADGDGRVPEEALIGQNLNQLEISNVGCKWYLENDYDHRDASFEEIFHFVHDYGIGTVRNPGALPDLANKIEEAMQNALPDDPKDYGKKGLWGYESEDWLRELKEEDSLAQEYIVSVIDSYYGLWEAWEETVGGMWGIYCAKSREEIREKDPVGYDLITSFLPENISQMLRIDPSFEGVFRMKSGRNVSYASKSQYLQNLSLTGDKNSGIAGNDLDNIFMGNSGDNVIDGGKGINVVQFRGASSEYEVTENKDGITVIDQIPGRDGTDRLKNIQILRFTDQDISVGS